MFANITAVFFDLDGTLVDSVPDLTAAINIMLQQLGLPKREEAQVRTWVGNGMDNLIRRALVGDMDGSRADPHCSPAPSRFTKRLTPTTSASTAPSIPAPAMDSPHCARPASPWPV